MNHRLSSFFPAPDFFRPLLPFETRFAPDADGLRGGGTADVELRIPLPGVETNDIDITLEADILSVRASRQLVPDAVLDSDAVTWRRRERDAESFDRRYRLPFLGAPESVEAEHVAGVLHIRVPVPERLRPTKIAVAAAPAAATVVNDPLDDDAVANAETPHD